MKYTNKYKLPRSIVDAVQKNTYDLSQTDQNIVSVTTLINPPIIRQLSIRHWNDVEEDVADNLWRLMGSAIHEVLSRISEDGRFIEERLKEPISGMTIAGRPDLYDIQEKSIEDYKLTSVWAVKYTKTEWEQQINYYAWFFRKLEFEVLTGYINALLRDWRRGEYLKNPKTYPMVPFKRIPVKLWSFETQCKHIEERIKAHQAVRNIPDEQLPICTKAERWNKDVRCKEYCPVNKFCPYYIFTYMKDE